MCSRAGCVSHVRLCRYTLRLMECRLSGIILAQTLWELCLKGATCTLAGNSTAQWDRGPSRAHLWCCLFFSFCFYLLMQHKAQPLIPGYPEHWGFPSRSLTSGRKEHPLRNNSWVSFNSNTQEQGWKDTELIKRRQVDVNRTASLFTLQLK